MSNGKFIERVQQLRTEGKISIEAAVDVMLSGVEQLYTLVETRIPEKLPQEHAELVQFKDEWEVKLKLMSWAVGIITTAFIGGLGSLLFLMMTHQIDIIWVPRP